MVVNTPNRPARRAAVVLSLAVAAVGLSGCGEAETPPVTGLVSGAVTYRGKPVTVGTVNLYHPETGTAAAAEIENGRYAVAAPLPVGMYTAYLSVAEPDPEPGVARPPARIPFPQRYLSSTASGLKVEVKEGSSEQPLALAD